MNEELLRQVLCHYRDLGFKDIYRMKPRKSAAAEAGVEDQPLPQPQSVLQSNAALEPNPELLPKLAHPSEPLIVSPQVEAPALFDVLPPLAPSDDTLEKIRADMGNCTRCRLHEGRHNIVFGVGNPQAKIVFVGEGPGEDEDLQGFPFVGRAGQLLTAMIENTAKKEGIPLTRPDVYIANVVKCRPPKNRTPEADEMEICGQFLSRQLEVIQPKAICSLGGTATRALLGAKEGVTKLRGKWYKWRNIPVMVTYHPSYLLRAYNVEPKREAWEDLKKLFHFAYD